MTHYVDGFVVPVPTKKLEAYRRIARKAGKVWIEYGALQYWECVGRRRQAGQGHFLPASVKLKDGETVVFSLDRLQVAQATRQGQRQGDEGSALADMMDPKKMPFDGMRMFWGGFKRLCVEL